MAVRVRYYTDPACIWSWGTEPKLRRLMWEFGDELEFAWVMGGLAREYGPGYRDPESGIGTKHGCFPDLVEHWLDATDEGGMPCDPRLWTQNPIASTYPACQAVEAAREQGEDAGYRYLRRVREGLVCERRKLDGAAALIAEAGPAGLDVERFTVDLSSHAIVERFGTDLEEVRDVPQDARDAGKVKGSVAGDRISFPSAVFLGERDERHAVWGWQPYASYREAALAAGAAAVNDRPAEPVEAIERFGRCATKEIEELSRRPRPLVEAELWKLTAEWKLRPVPVLIGTMWELA
jgi:predicted DsbA family dithiol-disulfide isomerase